MAKKKIAVFAKSDNRNMYQNLLNDTKLFRAKNIKYISSESELRAAENCEIFLVNSNDFENDLKSIAGIAQDTTAVILHATTHLDDLTMFDNQRNFMLVNYRGRLLNDILTSMMTIGYRDKT